MKRPKPLREPAAPPPQESLPHPVTFFLSAAERAAVLRVLRRHGRKQGDRADSLLAALGIDRTSKEQRP